MVDTDYNIELKMSSVTPNLEELSLKLSEVLEDIGVNDDMIQKGRQGAFFKESAYAVHHLIIDRGETMRAYLFGSQTEGTSTIGMDSDYDMLMCLSSENINVIGDLSNWQSGKMNLLMIQDETTAPGYCLLQLLRDDIPLPAERVPDNRFCFDNKGRVQMKHVILLSYIAHDRVKTVQQGPASTQMQKGLGDIDLVPALHCSQWPVEARQWLTRDNVGGWPNAFLKSRCEKSGCFLVPVDSKISVLVGKEIEWRISTSLAERYLMFSLNITHLKCYVIMKLLLKTYTVFHDVISSYMCKTTLLHCVESTKVDFWYDGNLITCLNKLLSELYHYIAHLNCPHFIIPGNNLMAGRISHSQQQKLLEVLDQLIKSEGRMLLDVQIDNLGDRLRHKLNITLAISLVLASRMKTQRYLSSFLSYNAARIVSNLFGTLIMFNTLSSENYIQKLKLKYKEIRNLYPQLDITKRRAARRYTSLLRTTVGALMASFSISIRRPVPNIAIEWLESGLKSDVSSSMLKLATVYYSSGNLNMTVDLLTRVDEMYDRNVVMPVCGCKHVNWNDKEEFEKVADKRQVTKYRDIVSYCVMFMNIEIPIVPLELRQEFSRSSQEELPKRKNSPVDGWMNLAVIDSLPYLYFLQYKTYTSLRQNEKKQKALEKLKNVMNEEPMISHTETVCNLLGQCMEQENRPNDALKYYQQSLQIRPEHNAANVYIYIQVETLNIVGPSVWTKEVGTMVLALC